MSKSLSLTFATVGILMLVLTGLALGFDRPWLALLSIILFIGVNGFGFALKSRLTKRTDQERD